MYFKKSKKKLWGLQKNIFFDSCRHGNFTHLFLFFIRPAAPPPPPTIPDHHRRGTRSPPPGALLERSASLRLTFTLPLLLVVMATENMNTIATIIARCTSRSSRLWAGDNLLINSYVIKKIYFSWIGELRHWFSMETPPLSKNLSFPHFCFYWAHTRVKSDDEDSIDRQ